MDLPDPALVFLVGPSGAGKSLWAAGRFLREEIVSSDALRAIVGSSESDLDASDDAFRLLREIVRARSGRRLTVVIDTTGLDNDLRAECLNLARESGLPAVAVGFRTGLDLCRSRNRTRLRPVPSDVIKRQHARGLAVIDGLESEGWDLVVRVDGTRDFVSPTKESRETTTEARASGMRFVLHISRFSWGAAAFADRLEEIARAAEEVGFAGISLMDHLVQIPQVGRPWEDIPEPFIALGFLAGVTEHIELGTLVTNVTLRNIGLLAKTVSTLDVLSGGRAFCGVGAGWNGASEAAYGYPPVSTKQRLDMLEDAVRLLPAMWGKGAVSDEGKTFRLTDAVTYPRPVRRHVPLIVGGGGEAATLRIAAEHADGVNVMGDLAKVVHKRAVLDRHCEAVGRDPTEVALTVLDVALVGESRRVVADLVEAHRGRFQTAAYAERHNAGTPEKHVERYQSLAAAGVDTIFVALPDLVGSEQVARFGLVLSKMLA